MTNERFNELLNGPLSHPMPMFVITRLSSALFVVVQATGEAGEKALEEYCAAREAKDRSDYEKEDQDIDETDAPDDDEESIPW